MVYMYVAGFNPENNSTLTSSSVVGNGSIMCIERTAVLKLYERFLQLMSDYVQCLLFVVGLCINYANP